MADETTPSAEPQAGTPETNPQPQAGNTTTTEPQAGASQNTPPSKSADDYERMLADLRKENAGHRTKLKKFEEDETKRQEAQLSEQQKLEKRAADAEKALEEHKKSAQQRLLDSEVRLQAAQLGIKYPDKAAKLIDTASLDLDADDLPTKVAALLKDLLKEMPELAGKAAAATSGGATNPSRSATSGTQELTRTYVGGLKPADYAALSAEEKLRISQWIAGGGMLRR